MKFASSKIKINIITTGGTIEKTYDEQDGSLLNRGPLIRQKILDKLRLPFTDIDVTPILSKDSLYMDENDRAFLLKSLEEKLAEGHPVLVLHGTDTMALSAEYCFDRLKNLNVPVVFTGAMRPMGFDDSDAQQNVTEALLALRLLAPGFYISFHNCILPVPKVRKNKEKGHFEFA
jgi:L-asparaginase